MEVVGGNAFNTTMQSTDISKLATCTTCGYSEDVRAEYEGEGFLTMLTLA